MRRREALVSVFLAYPNIEIESHRSVRDTRLLIRLAAYASRLQPTCLLIYLSTYRNYVPSYLDI